MHPNPAIPHSVLRDSSLKHSPYLADHIYHTILIGGSTLLLMMSHPRWGRSHKPRIPKAFFSLGDEGQ